MQKFYHLFIFKRYNFSQNLKGVTSKIGPPRPIQFQNTYGGKQLNKVPCFFKENLNLFDMVK